VRQRLEGLQRAEEKSGRYAVRKGQAGAIATPSTRQGFRCTQRCQALLPLPAGSERACRLRATGRACP
jgi:hypothetical protein